MTHVEARPARPVAHAERGARPEGRSRRRAPSPVLLACAAAVLYLPFVGMGYGTDIDITNILRSGESIFDGGYRYSRPPGSFPHELLTGVLDRIGGAVAVNVASVGMAVAVLVLLARIVRREFGDRAARIAVVIVATQPWFWVAASSLGDYLYALALLLAGIDAHQRGRGVLALLAFGTAVGFRSGTGLLVASYLAAHLAGRWLDDDGRDASGDGPEAANGDGTDAAPASPAARTINLRDDRSSHRPGAPASPVTVRDTALVGVGAAAVAAAWFLPPWLSVGRTAQFLQNQLRAGDFGVMVARWGIKNLAFFGVVTLVVLAVRAPVLVDAVRRHRTSPLVRFAVLAAVVTEATYLRFPWKPIHLLPMIVAVAVLLAASRRTSNRLVAVVVASQVVLAAVSITIAAPDVADAATSGELDLGFTRGVVHNELDCRLRTESWSGHWPALDTPDADFAAVGVFACQARSWRAGAGPTKLSPNDPPG